jgi:hypothetical protein
VTHYPALPYPVLSCPALACALILFPPQENDQLTAKMSLRRNNIVRAYASLVDDIYNGTEGFDISHDKEKAN